MPGLQVEAARKTEFQVVLHLLPVPNDDQDLTAVAELALEALVAEAPGLALGPVVGVDLDRRSVEIETTVEALSASEAHQKMGLILGALERGGPFIVQDSSTKRARDPESVPA